MLFASVAATSERLAATSKRTEKTAALVELLRELAPGEVPIVVGFLTGAPRQGRIGVGWRTLQAAGEAPAAAPSLSVLDIDRAIDELAAMSGGGVQAARRRVLGGLFERATASEQRMLWRVLSGELRQGALDGVMGDAIARAAAVPVAVVRRAHMFAGDLGATASAALGGGRAALDDIGLEPGRAVRPMLASSATNVAEAIDATGRSSVEWKLDGARVQAHRRDGEVRLFTRNLNDVTARLGGVVALTASLPGGDLVLDGEVLGVSDDGSPRRFQDTMAELGTRSIGRPAEPGTGPGRSGGPVGLGAFFFDVLHADGASVVDEPLSTRRELLASLVPVTARLPSIITADAVEAAAFLDVAVAAGHEGVMVKNLAAAYDAGRRGKAWRKVKPVHTLDLVILAAEWGHGRRTGWLSNLHLGARGDDGEYVMVGKTFKGLTDELLAWQTERLQRLAIGGEDGWLVHVRPELVAEVAVDGVQASTRYPGGVALRFARVRRYRDDKAAADADHITIVQAMLR
ncbi:MAG: ATP-dependent DNA ligase [Desertimonas sp.]